MLRDRRKTENSYISVIYHSTSVSLAGMQQVRWQRAELHTVLVRSVHGCNVPAVWCGVRSQRSQAAGMERRKRETEREREREREPVTINFKQCRL
jgi:hypothetical protein